MKLLHLLLAPVPVYCSLIVGDALGQVAPQAVTSTGQANGMTSVLQTEPACVAGPEGGDCEVHGAIFAAPVQANGQGHRALNYQQLKTFGPSINFGNAGGWTVTHVFEAPHLQFGTSGIDQYISAAMDKNGTGDLAGIYLYVHGGGRAAQSDEGVTGITVESGEIGGYFHGTVAGVAGVGATALTLAYNATAPNNWGYTCDGCMLLDISKGRIAGRLNGRSQPFGSSYLYQLPTTGVTGGSPAGQLPLTRAWCTSSTAIPASTRAGVGTSRTIRCTLGAVGGSTPALTAGSLATIAGPSYPEQVPITAVTPPEGGVQTLTLLARNPNPAGAVLFQGGIAGQSLSFDDNLAASGYRSSYYVFGSIDGVNLIYGSQIGGTVATHQLPRAGSEAEQINSGFHLYPSAEIVANTAAASAPMLEPNAVEWAVGDAVENPRFQSYGGVGLRNICQEFTPTDQENTSSCMVVDVAGPGVSGTYHPFRILNGNGLKQYTQGGGRLEPVPAESIEGTFGNLIDSYRGPSRNHGNLGAVIAIGHTAADDNTPFNLFSLPNASAPGVTTVGYDPASMLIGFSRGIATTTLNTGNCASTDANPNCVGFAAGSIVIRAGASSVNVQTTALTANSQVLITPDTTLDARLKLTCNKNPATAFAPYGITGRYPGKGFTLSVATPLSGSPNCYSFMIVN
jgi:hypothetical protein